MNTHDQFTGLNAFEGFAEKVGATVKPLTEEHVQSLARWLYVTKKVDSMVAADSEARAQVQAANERRNTSNLVNSRSQAAAPRLQVRLVAVPQPAAIQRHTAHIQNRLTASVNALARQLRQCSAR